MKDVIHIVNPGGAVTAKNLRVSGGYAICGARVIDLPPPGTRASCPKCLELEREDDLQLKRMQEA